MPSVLHVVISLDCGGLEHVVLDLCRHASEEGRRVGVVCLERPGKLADAAADAGAEVVSLDKRPGIDWRLRGRLGGLFRDWQPEVVHTHQIGALFYAGPAAGRVGIPVVHTEHGKHYDSSRKLRWLACYASRHCQKYIGVAPDVVSHALDWGIVAEAKTAVITNGVSFRSPAEDRGLAIRRELGISYEAPLIGSVGRLEPVKNYPLLLGAFALVCKQIPDARLLLVGDGTQRAALEQIAGELGVADAVRFAGYQSDCTPYYEAMDAFCLTSDSEGLPLSLLEAMAAGTPVAASRVGGIPGVIRHGESGLLFERRNACEAAEALTTLIAERPLAERYASHAREHAHQHYSSEAMAAAYASLYRRAVTEA